MRFIRVKDYKVWNGKAAKDFENDLHRILKAIEGHIVQ